MNREPNRHLGQLAWGTKTAATLPAQPRVLPFEDLDDPLPTASVLDRAEGDWGKGTRQGNDANLTQDEINIVSRCRLRTQLSSEEPLDFFAYRI